MNSATNSKDFVLETLMALYFFSIFAMFNVFQVRWANAFNSRGSSEALPAWVIQVEML